MATPQLSRSTRRSWLVGIAMTALLIAAAARFVHDHGSTAPIHTPHTEESDIGDYVGNAACAGCHPSEFRLHQASSHFLTLRPMTRAALGSLAPPAGRINDSQYSIVEADGRFYFDVNVPGRPDQYQRWPLDYAF